MATHFTGCTRKGLLHLAANTPETVLLPMEQSIGKGIKFLFVAKRSEAPPKRTTKISVIYFEKGTKLDRDSDKCDAIRKEVADKRIDVIACDSDFVDDPIMWMRLFQLPYQTIPSKTLIETLQ